MRELPHGLSTKLRDKLALDCTDGWPRGSLRRGCESRAQTHVEHTRLLDQQFRGEMGYATLPRACRVQPRRPASPDGDAVLEPDPSGDSGCCFQVEGRRRQGRLQRLPRRRIDRPVRPAKNRNSSASSSMKVCCLSACLVAAACAVAHAGSGDTQKLLDFYANQAKATDSAFGGFSASAASRSSGPILRAASPTPPLALSATRRTQEMLARPEPERTLTPWRSRQTLSGIPIKRRPKSGLGETAETSWAGNAPREKKATSSLSCLLNDNAIRTI
jgi:hypothetical protein